MHRGSAKTPAELRAACCSAVRSLTRFNAETPSQRLLADSAAQGMLGMARALNGLYRRGRSTRYDRRPGNGAIARPRLAAALRQRAPRCWWRFRRYRSSGSRARGRMGHQAITFCAIIVVLLPLQGDMAYSASMTFLKGCVLGCGVAAVLVFGILPRVDNIPKSVPRLGTWRSCRSDLCSPERRIRFLFFAASVNFLPMLSVNNTISFEASQFWNSSSAILIGIAIGAVAMLIVPSGVAGDRTSRLLALTLADLRRLAKRAPSEKAGG